MKKIILLGYMGSGKSSVKELLAKELAIQDFDLDELIEKSQQKSISDIFLEQGEVYFRKIESQIFRSFINKETEKDFVLALGGGTPCYADNHKILKEQDVISIYLKTSTPTLIKRLYKEKSSRPIIAHLSDKELTSFIDKHLFDRSFYYHQAKYIVTTDNKKLNEIVTEIVNLLI